METLDKRTAKIKEEGGGKLGHFPKEDGGGSFASSKARMELGLTLSRPKHGTLLLKIMAISLKS